MNQMQQPGQQLRLEDSVGFQCDNCGGLFFKQSMLVRKWSKLLIGTPQDHVDVIPVFRCEDCNEVLKEFFPRGMKDIEEILNLGEPESVESNKAKKIQFIQ